MDAMSRFRDRDAGAITSGSYASSGSDASIARNLSTIKQNQENPLHRANLLPDRLPLVGS